MGQRLNTKQFNQILVQEAAKRSPTYAKALEKAELGILSQEEAKAVLGSLSSDQTFTNTLLEGTKAIIGAQVDAAAGMYDKSRFDTSNWSETNRSIQDLATQDRGVRQQQDLQNIINPQLKHDMTTRIIGSGMSLLPLLFGN